MTERPTAPTANATAAGATGTPAPPAWPVLDMDAVLDDPSRRVVVCCGAGGVGKTTTAAALAIRAADRGRKVAVITIDPARRLAQALGVEALDNTPRRVPDVGREGGSLEAMMLDMKRTFDELVRAHASRERAEQVLANPVYEAVSTSFAGTQEYMAMERLGQLRTEAEASGRWDLIVVDTPPSRSALDFLDAPSRLGSFLDGRFIRALTAPARVGGKASLKVMNAGIGLAHQVFGRLLGAQFLTDVSTFVAAMDSMFGGLRARAEQTYALLSDSGTAFVVVCSPERDALREATAFVERLVSDRMPLVGVVVNRVGAVAPGLSGPRALATAEQVDDEGAPDVAALLRRHAVLAERAQRHRQTVASLAAAHPGVAMVTVAARAEDLRTLEGLRGLGEDLCDLE